MSGYATSETTAQEARTGSVEHDWRFAELVARSYLQPELALRYALDPRIVLAEFGIPLAPGTAIPALPKDSFPEVRITRLDKLEATAKLCGSTWGPFPPQPALKSAGASSR
ncbi:TIGR04351 family putative TOMM peptide [Streptomyces sp. NPDC020681]|uniref:TIGR04351 family putative TOMM peptide n=1 Tax=Streptomyces sp. NPDC020681 TaxID=3365083 RepID=UPI0037AA9E09